jgi:UDP-galactopyranose mutase
MRKIMSNTARLKTRKSPPGHPLMPISFERLEETFDSARDLVCFSHLRWDFVYQRPQHLMSRFAREGRVFYIEEPVHSSGAPHLVRRIDKSGVCVVVPHLPNGLAPEAVRCVQSQLLHDMFAECGIRQCIAWFYTPMAYAFTHDLPFGVVVYDCMDELSLFRDAPRELIELESRLVRVADVIFTGGVSLYEAKRSLHRNVHAMPSSIDVEHFMSGRRAPMDPADQASIGRPRLGFAGVIDERMDIDLIKSVAESHPDWQFVLIGPVVKIDPATLPQGHNIHYLGKKIYNELPAYIGNWDVALMPFAKNDATRYISPTKTPEYLASGKPVVSTSIRDVVQTYRPLDLVEIADTPEEFARAIDKALTGASDPAYCARWRERADQFLAKTSWEQTWLEMRKLIDSAIDLRQTPHANAS